MMYLKPNYQVSKELEEICFCTIGCLLSKCSAGILGERGSLLSQIKKKWLYYYIQTWWRLNSTNICRKWWVHWFFLVFLIANDHLKHKTKSAEFWSPVFRNQDVSSCMLVLEVQEDNSFLDFLWSPWLITA